MRGARAWPLTTVVAGAVTLAIVIAISWLAEVRAAYASGEFAAAFSAFQRATTMAELNALFGDPADPAKLAAMSAGNALDLYAFIPAYVVFLIAATAMLAGGLRKLIAWLAVVPALIGAGADVFETWTQMQMTADWSLDQIRRARSARARVQRDRIPRRPQPLAHRLAGLRPHGWSFRLLGRRAANAVAHDHGVRHLLDRVARARRH
jgi:hypothetical protein